MRLRLVLVAIVATACDSILGIQTLSPDCASSSSQATCDTDTTSDPNNCGTCGHSCLGGMCVSSTCTSTTLTQAQGFTLHMLLANQDLVWITERALLSVPTSGGQIEPLVPQLTPLNMDQAYALTADSVYAYWADSEDDGGGAIKRVPLDGGGVTTILSGTAENDVPNVAALAVTPSFVYWTYAPFGEIWRAPLDGSGTKERVAMNEPGANGLAVDSTSIYWADDDDAGAIKRLALDAAPLTTPTPLAAGLDGPSPIVLHDGFIFFAERATGVIARLSASGGDVLVLASGQDQPSSIAADCSYVYWTTSADVMAVPTAGGTPVVLAQNQASPAAIVIDDAAVYWVNGADNNNIQKVAKP